jgi:hypothetical protein
VDLVPSSGKDVLRAANLRLRGEKLVELGQADAGQAALQEAAALGGPVSHSAPGGWPQVPFQHATAGTLRLAYELLDLSIVEQQYLVVCLPADDHTRRAFDRLSAGTGC